MRLIERTAYHEAGHAVVGLQLGIPIKKVTIERDGDYLGFVESKKIIQDDEEGGDDQFALLGRVSKVIVREMAGAIAERRAAGRTYAEMSRQDQDEVKRRAWSVTASMNQHKAYLAWLTLVAHDTVNTHWPLIEALACELLERNTMSGRRLGQFLLGLEKAKLSKKNRQVSRLAREDSQFKSTRAAALRKKSKK